MRYKRRLPSLPLLIILGSLALSGCYEDYINIFTEFTPGIYNQSETEIAFFHFLMAGKPPKGISRFPDGGSHEVLFKDVTLYRYNIQTGELNTLFRYGNLPSDASFWRGKISWHRNKIIFCISPLSSWEWIIKQSSNSRYIPFYNDFSGIFICNITDNTVTRLTNKGFEPALSPNEDLMVYLVSDSVKTELRLIDLSDNTNKSLTSFPYGDEYHPGLRWLDGNTIILSDGKKSGIFKIDSGKMMESDNDFSLYRRRISQTEIKKLTEGITFQEWGLDLATVWPRKRKEYIGDIISLNGNLNYRKAILEKTGSDMDILAIENIIDQMKEYQNSLEGLERMNYEIFSEETVDLLEKLLLDKEKKMN
ncbi:MAG: hypothetical protein JSV24_03155 [Bacteroidales bacterium]|nr:MAG: hypothetical protein JSV24_03155 [Bacteroidales bacterium]